MVTDMQFVNHMAAWRALLGAFRTHCYAEMGEFIVQQILELEP